MMNTIGDGWIGNKYYQDRVAYISAKDCNFDKSKFKEVVESEIEDKINLVTDIQEGYYRIKRSNDWEYEEYGEYCYHPCKKGKGATLIYFGGFEFVEGEKQ